MFFTSTVHILYSDSSRHHSYLLKAAHLLLKVKKTKRYKKHSSKLDHFLPRPHISFQLIFKAIKRYRSKVPYTFCCKTPLMLNLYEIMRLWMKQHLKPTLPLLLPLTVSPIWPPTKSFTPWSKHSRYLAYFHFICIFSVRLHQTLLSKIQDEEIAYI